MNEDNNIEKKKFELIKKDEPKRRLLHYCSVECRREHDEIKKIRKKLGALTIFWPPQKPPVDKSQLTYTLSGGNGEQIKYKARKIEQI